MYNNTNRLRNIELPENLFSNLGESKKNKNIQPTIRPTIRPSEKNKDEDILKKYNIDNDLKLTNYSNKKEYRDRIKDLRDRTYESMKKEI